jgi:hypothetical protein
MPATLQRWCNCLNSLGCLNPYRSATDEEEAEAMRKTLAEPGASHVDLSENNDKMVQRKKTMMMTKRKEDHELNDFERAVRVAMVKKINQYNEKEELYQKFTPPKRRRSTIGSKSVLEDDETDPMARFGPGVLSYFELIRQLQRTFCTILLLVIPMMFIYSSFGGMDYIGEDQSFLHKYSFGNIGFPEAIVIREVLWTELHTGGRQDVAHFNHTC